jgi:hypothetical protein
LNTSFNSIVADKDRGIHDQLEGEDLVFGEQLLVQLPDGTQLSQKVHIERTPAPAGGAAERREAYIIVGFGGAYCRLYLRQTGVTAMRLESCGSCTKCGGTGVEPPKLPSYTPPPRRCPTCHD